MNRRFPLLVLAALALCFLAARGATPPRPTIALGAIGRGPTVVLVHGLGSDSRHWLPVARDLARDHHVVLVDLPGHGLSGLPSPFSLDEAAAMLDRALEELGEGPVVLVGHSVGGLVCTAEALRSPSRVRALVLVETALRPQVSPADRAALELALEQDFAHAFHAAYEAFGRDSLQGIALADQAAQLDPRMLRPWITLVLNTDLSRQVQALRMPVLAVVAPGTWEPGESWSAAAESLGYSRIAAVSAQRVDDSGHFIMLDHPHTVANAIRRFARNAHAPVLALR